MNALRRIAAGIAAKKVRIAEIMTGHGGKFVEGMLFDRFLYGTVSIFCQENMGTVEGSFVTFLIMAPLSALVCSFYLRFYDWLGRDIFGFESIKDLEGESGWFFRRFVIPLLRKGDTVAFVLLSVFSDPFLTVVYLRDKSRRYAGMGKREKRIFWSSVLLSNAYWTLSISVFVGIGRWVWYNMV